VDHGSGALGRRRHEPDLSQRTKVIWVAGRDDAACPPCPLKETDAGLLGFALARRVLDRKRAKSGNRRPVSAECEPSLDSACGTTLAENERRTPSRRANRLSRIVPFAIDQPVTGALANGRRPCLKKAVRMAQRKATLMLMSKCFKMGNACLLIYLGTACGSSGAGASDGGNPSVGGNVSDQGNPSDGGNPPTMADLSDGGNPPVGGSPSEGGAAPDGGSLTLPVNLGTAANYAILAKSGISTVPTSAITGNLGISPAAAAYITGFPLTADSTNVFSTSSQVTGKIYAADYAVPTPSDLTTAVSDMQATSAGRPWPRASTDGAPVFRSRRTSLSAAARRTSGSSRSLRTSP
jgi:hypothetical protein